MEAPGALVVRLKPPWLALDPAPPAIEKPPEVAAADGCVAAAVVKPKSPPAHSACLNKYGR